MKRAAGIDLPIATGRQKHGEKMEPANGPAPRNASVKEAMRAQTADRGRTFDLQNAEGDRGTGLCMI